MENKKLKSVFHDWKGVIKEYDVYAEKSADWTMYTLLNSLGKNISFLEMDRYGGYYWAGKSKLKTSKYKLFQNLEFENYLDNKMFYSKKLLDLITELDVIVDQILEETKME